MLIPGIATNRDEIEVNPWSLSTCVRASYGFVLVRVGSCQFVFVVSIRFALVSIRVARAGLC